MKTTKTALFLATAPLMAQGFEVGIFAGQQTYPVISRSIPGLPTQIKTDSKISTVLRFGYSVVDLGPALLQVTAGYQPETKTTATISGGGLPVVSGYFKNSHYSVGAMANFKAFVAIGLGVEYRFETLTTGNSTNYSRPWARANVGLAIPSPFLKPFVGVEAAIPMTSTSDTNSTPDNLLKSMAPKGQIGIYAGVRF